MRPALRIGLLSRTKPTRLDPTNPWRQHCRSIATHTSSHHASALSVLPTKVDTSSADFKENAMRFDELMTSMREIHEKVALGGPQKAREKHLARGKMLPREYVVAPEASCADKIGIVVVLPPSSTLELRFWNCRLWRGNSYTLERMFRLVV